MTTQNTQLLNLFGLQKMQPGAEGETGQRFYNRDTFKDLSANLAMGLNSMRLNPDASLPQRMSAQIANRKQDRTRNRTVEALRKKAEGGDKLAAKYLSAIESGALPVAQAMSAYMQEGAQLAAEARRLAATRAAEDRAEARAAAAREFEAQQPQTTLGKIKRDLANGIITQEEAAARIKKLNYIAPSSANGLPATYEALLLRADAAGLKPGTPEFEEFMKRNGRPVNPLSDRYQSKGAYVVDGEIIGDVAFDKVTGEFFYGTGDDRTVIDITKAQPVTDSFFNIGIPTAKEFKTLRTDLKDDRTSLKRYTSYLKNVDNANVGLGRLADEMSSYFKTLLSSNAKKYNLTEEELALRIAKGELQGLIGRSRIETVGGGVMTEQDALRIISNLGGNVDFLQNPEVVRAQISRMFEDKYNSYNGKLRDYNVALDSRYRGLGYKEIEPLEIDASILDPKVAENLGLDVPPDDPDPAEGGLSVGDINAMPYDEMINMKEEIYSTLSVDALKAIQKRITERK